MSVGAKCLSSEGILSAEDRPLERVDVPEWEGHLFVRVMSGSERGEWEAGVQGRPAAERLLDTRASLVLLCACDETGKRLFTAAQAEELGNKSAVALNRVFERAVALNALSDKGIEDLEGNSEGTPSEDSGFDSPDASGAQ